MGLIKAAFSSIGTVLADQWKEYIYCDALDGDTLMAKGEVRINKGSSNTKRSILMTQEQNLLFLIVAFPDLKSLLQR